MRVRPVKICAGIGLQRKIAQFPQTRPSSELQVFAPPRSEPSQARFCLRDFVGELRRPASSRSVSSVPFVPRVLRKELRS